MLSLNNDCLVAIIVSLPHEAIRLLAQVNKQLNHACDLAWPIKLEQRIGRPSSLRARDAYRIALQCGQPVIRIPDEGYEPFLLNPALQRRRDIKRVDARRHCVVVVTLEDECWLYTAMDKKHIGSAQDALVVASPNDVLLVVLRERVVVAMLFDNTLNIQRECTFKHTDVEQLLAVDSSWEGARVVYMTDNHLVDAHLSSKVRYTEHDDDVSRCYVEIGFSTVSLHLTMKHETGVKNIGKRRFHTSEGRDAWTTGSEHDIVVLRGDGTLHCIGYDGDETHLDYDVIWVRSSYDSPYVCYITSR
jgi:hypothetical protein